MSVNHIVFYTFMCEIFHSNNQNNIHNNNSLLSTYGGPATMLRILHVFISFFLTKVLSDGHYYEPKFTNKQIKAQVR